MKYLVIALLAFIAIMYFVARFQPSPEITCDVWHGDIYIPCTPIQQEEIEREATSGSNQKRIDDNERGMPDDRSGWAE